MAVIAIASFDVLGYQDCEKLLGVFNQIAMSIIQKDICLVSETEVLLYALSDDVETVAGQARVSP